MLTKRYPQLAFLMSCATPHCITCSDKLAAEVSLEGVKLSYVYGIGLGKHLEVFWPWLEESSEHDLVIVEDNLGAIERFLDEPIAKKVIDHPRIHLMVPFESSISERAFCDECAKKFPEEKLITVAMKGYEGQKFDAFTLEVKRATTLSGARFQEQFYRDRLLKNVCMNFKRMPGAFFAHDLKDAYKGACAIVCGAGPSLKDCIEDLKQVKGKALILAGGSAIPSLSNQGIMPDFGLAVDPNEGEYIRLKASCAYEMPLLIGARLHCDVLNTTSAEIGYLQTISSDPIEIDIMEALGLPFEPLGEAFGEEAMSVTTTAIAFAEMIGCDRIVLAGVDLAFTGQKRYAPGVFSDVSVDFKKEQVFEASPGVYTNIQWLMESKAIAKFAKQSKATLYRASNKGLVIDGIDVQSIDNLNLTSNVNPLYMNSVRRIGDVSSALYELGSSLEKCMQVLGELIEALDLKKPSIDHPLITIGEMDLTSEKAYRLILEPSLPALEYAATRKCRGDDAQSIWKRKRSLYKQLKRLSLATFSTMGYKKANETVVLQSR
ncbi:MAG: motility associated factor glycosyltransferase family protein [Chlamydiales bacterium]|nr:motility associated factor glycosyltransferase family protein [Chlamydiales bacterium]